MIVQVAPALSVAVQVPPGREYGPLNVTVMPVKLAAPVLCRVSVWEALVVPSATLPKDRGPPVTLATAGLIPRESSRRILDRDSHVHIASAELIKRVVK